MLDDVEVDGLLKIVLLLVIVWLVLEIVSEFVYSLLGLLGPLRPIVGLLIVALVVWWLYDRL